MKPLFVNVRWRFMDSWQTARRAALRRATGWQVEAAHLREAALHAHDTISREQLLMFAEDCEDQAMREFGGQTVTLR
jgi:hypothetical protein